jgi:hypothetical protein
MTVRMWITAVEAASLIWLDEGKQPPVEELRDWLVEQFVAALSVTAGRDPQTAALAENLAEQEAEQHAEPSAGQPTADS